MRYTAILFLILATVSCTEYGVYDYVILKPENDFIPIYYILGMLDDGYFRLRDLEDGRLAPDFIESFYPREIYEAGLFEYYIRVLMKEAEIGTELSVSKGLRGRIMFRSGEVAKIIYSYYENIDSESPVLDMAIFNGNRKAMISYLAGVYSRSHHNGRLWLHVTQDLKTNLVVKVLQELTCNDIKITRLEIKDYDDLPVGGYDMPVSYKCGLELEQRLKNYDADIRQ
ncbi:MAG: hypothetical protein KAV42_01060 [Candidatus Krumholzibacteria bacterium]|nr:hypothetical protein [Candidatus Krumholzibacteria bacterium]